MPANRVQTALQIKDELFWTLTVECYVIGRLIFRNDRGL